MKSFTIGEFAKQAGVGVETVRFYEREGLLKEPPRRPSGHREYPEGEVTRLVFIRREIQEERSSSSPMLAAHCPWRQASLSMWSTRASLHSASSPESRHLFNAKWPS